MGRLLGIPTWLVSGTWAVQAAIIVFACTHGVTTCDSGKAGDWERTVQIYEALQDSDLKADVWTFTSLINACQRCGNDWKSGLEVFQDMEEQGKTAVLASAIRRHLANPECTCNGGPC